VKMLRPRALAVRRSGARGQRVSTVLWCLLALACGDPEPPTVRLGAMPTCPDLSSGCLNVGAATLDVGGVRVIYKRTPGQPLAALRMLFDNGTRGERQMWAERLALTMVQIAGPSTRTPSSWQGELDKLGAVVAFTPGADYATLSGTVAAPRAIDLWRLLREALRNPPQSQFQLDHFARLEQRNVVVRGDQPQLAAQDEAWSLLMQRTPADETASLAELSTVRAGDVSQAFGTLLDKPRITVVVVGDVLLESVRAEVEQLVGALPTMSANPFPAPAASQAGDVPGLAATAVLPYPDAPTWHIAGYFRGPPADSEDHAALRLGLAILDNRLYARIRDERGLAYTVGARPYFYRETVGYLWLSTNAPGEALPIMQTTLAELRVLAPTNSELTSARQTVRTQIFEASDTPAGLCATLADWQLTVGDRTRIDTFLTQLDTLTTARVHESLTKFLRNGAVVAAGGGSELAESQLQALLPP